MAKKHGDVIDNGVPLRERVERFCGHFVMTNNEMHSYRLAFVVDKHAAAQWVFKQARELLQDPSVRERVQELRDTAAKSLLVSVQDLIQDWVDIATADPNELVAHVHVNCRFCYGAGHAYQWADDAEYAAAVDAALKKDKPIPDCSGGFGFNDGLEPLLTCPSCYGRGYGRVRIADTTKLSSKALKLYAGAKQDRFGSVEILMHSQEKARESLARTLGAFKDGVPVLPLIPVAGAQTIPDNISSADAGRGYLRLINGGAA